MPGQLSGRGDIERADEPDHRGDLVGRQRRPAIGQDLSADLVAPAGVTAFSQNDVGDHDGAGDRAAPGFGARHADLSMPVDDGFYFFRMNLEAADINDAAAPSHEVVSTTTQFDHVAGIDEPICIGQRRGVWADIGTGGSGRANPERSVFDFHFDATAVLPDQGGGETFQASLALALALSAQMSSLAAAGAARLDSIFLDEGFGTLDPETLEVVATTLETLAQGQRMVGVITHVAALAERVPVRFLVSRNARTSTVVREGLLDGLADAADLAGAEPVDAA